jgi:hypothetical protein
MGLTRPRAAQIFDIDYKQSARAVTVENITLTGAAPATVDGVTLVTKDRILVTGQTDPSENGIYDVVVTGVGADGTWVRTNDANDDGEIKAGMISMVTEGLVYHDSQWRLTTDNPIYIGTTPLTFIINILSPGGANTQVQLNDGGILSGFSNFVFDKVSNALTVVGNIHSTHFVGDGRYVTGVVPYQNATENVNLGSHSLATTGSISAGTVDSDLVPLVDLQYSLGNATHRWSNLYLSGNTIYLGNSIITESENGDVVIGNTGSFVVPMGSTQQRSNVMGSIRFNNSTNRFETYDGVGWNSLLGAVAELPIGNYGAIDDMLTTDAFGVILINSFDCNAPGLGQPIDFGIIHDQAAN